MEELLQKANINYSKLKSIIHRVSANELSNLAEPCYYPSIKKNYFELLYACGITEKDTKELVKRFWKGMPEAKRQLPNDNISMFYIFCMYALLKKREKVAYNSMMLLFNIRYYTNRMYRMMKFCNPNVFKYTLEHMTKTHLFIKEKSIPNTIYYLSKAMIVKHTKKIGEADNEGISKFITECRTRMAQSVRSFAQAYYKFSKEGAALKAPIEQTDDGEDYQVQTQEKDIKIIEDAVKRITIYKTVDAKALNESKQLTKINTSLATLIANSLGDVKYSDNIKVVLQLFLKDISNVKAVCSQTYYKYVRGLMAIKRTKDLLYFKQQVNVLLQRLLKDIKYDRKYGQLTKQTQFLINLYLAYYITMSLRNKIC